MWGVDIYNICYCKEFIWKYYACRGLLKLNFETYGLLPKTYGFGCKQKRLLDANSRGMGELVMEKQLEQQVMG